MQLIRKLNEPISIVEMQKSAIRKGVKIDNLEQILMIMEMRGEISLMNNIIFKRGFKYINSPCIECSARDVCTPGGKISPSNCPYLLAW